MNTFIYERNPFDILVRNFFQDASKYSPLAETKIPHPVDIYTNEKGLFFEVACTGISKSDLEIQTQDNILRINYDKNKDASCCEVNDCDYIHKGIAKRSFNLGWKIDSKFELSKANAEFKDGLLKIEIPFAKGAELKTLKIS
jgi:HSP20 family molecular chaperone IbpA|tara:strand:- start:12792 stop:13217 length:426 start_codon:yes stop_codon:yes gene_type:complete